MLNRIIRKLRFMYLQSRIKKSNPFYKIDASLISRNMQLLKPYHSQYIREISTPDMAASLELAGTLLSICQANGYKKFADLGSGFSSFVLRYYAKSYPDVEVYSVDDNNKWLEKTRNYLKSVGVTDSKLFTLEEFLAGKFSDFDCILHDLNFVEVRINHVSTLLSKLSTHGVLILDDMHKPDYRFEVLTKMEKEPFDIYDLRELTLDSFGRYSMIALRR